jgi:hypothetical protein
MATGKFCAHFEAAIVQSMRAFPGCLPVLIGIPSVILTYKLIVCRTGMHGIVLCDYGNADTSVRIQAALQGAVAIDFWGSSGICVGVPTSCGLLTAIDLWHAFSI